MRGTVLCSALLWVCTGLELELEPRKLELLQARVACTEEVEEVEEVVRMPEPVG